MQQIVYLFQLSSVSVMTAECPANDCLWRSLLTSPVFSRSQMTSISSKWYCKKEKFQLSIVTHTISTTFLVTAFI
jgi:hypothetical protein